jgi:hypothetical protein
MRLGIIVASIGAAALMSSLAYAQNTPPPEVERAFKQAVPMKRAEQPSLYSEYRTEALKSSSSAPTPQDARTSTSQLSLARPSTRAVGTVSSPRWTDETARGDDVSGVLSAGSR